MTNKLKILQLGPTDWSQELTLPENMDWYHFYPQSSLALKKVMEMDKIRKFSAILVPDLELIPDLYMIEESIVPYTVFYDQSQETQEADIDYFLRHYCAQPADFSDKAELVRLLSKALFSGQYGDKMSTVDMVVNPGFKGKVSYKGYSHLELEGDYGQDFRPLLSFKYNVFASKNNPVELWLEYQKEGDLSLQLRVYSIQEGSVADIAAERVYSEADLQEPVLLDQDYTSYLGVTVEAKGSGRLQISALHQRLTRYQFGKYVLGGRILRDQKRQEINYFFYPGDLQPPLAVYFSGYRRAEGFEGFGMMRGLGIPFLLISDPRIEGGGFYLGSQELEDGVHQIIRDHLDRLGFTERDLILSGMSMGTYGAMYYGAGFRPRAIILSKPLANLGTIAERGRLRLPEVFPTALDVLYKHTGGKGREEVQALNQRFWQKFSRADFSRTTFGLAYMKDEDYDPTAYQDLLAALHQTDAKVISKGASGRHNDDSVTMISWFVNFYKMILEKEFGRKK